MKKVIYWPVKWGKTTALVEEARKVSGVVIAKSDASKKYIYDKWGDIEVYTLQELVNGLDLNPEKELFIDDADDALKLLLSGVTECKISGLSITMDRPY